MTLLRLPLATDDLAIAKRCASGDLHAIKAVTAANNQRLFRAAWSILKNRSEAEDAVQSAYLNAFASIDKFVARSSLSTWLTRIVINEALARARSLAKHRERLEAQGVAMMNDYRTVDAPDVALARQQLRGLMERAVADLPDTFRMVFVLRDVEGLSVEETSDALEIPAATVKSRLFRARRRLQMSLAPEVRTALVGTFPFAGLDCERLTARVVEAVDHWKGALPGT